MKTNKIRIFWKLISMSENNTCSYIHILTKLNHTLTASQDLNFDSYTDI